MITTRNCKFWFCTGSQNLYGDECLRNVAEHSKIIVEKLNASGSPALRRPAGRLGCLNTCNGSELGADSYK